MPVTTALRRNLLRVLCALLCWALVIAPCFGFAGLSFASSGDSDSVIQMNTVPVVPADKPSAPVEISGENPGDSTGGAGIAQNIAPPDHGMSLLENDKDGSSAQLPSKPAAVIKPPAPPVVDDSKPAGNVQEGNSHPTGKYALLPQPDGKSFMYYEQFWPEYASHPYGYNTVGSHGCGPTSMAMVITNLTGKFVNPAEMADWSVKNGFYVRGRGTAYGLFPAASARYGIECQTISAYDKQAVVSALRSGKLILTVVGPGDFTYGRHFLLIRGITNDGKLLLADSASYDKCLTEWSYGRVASQIANGSMWVFGK